MEAGKWEGDKHPNVTAGRFLRGSSWASPPLCGESKFGCLIWLIIIGRPLNPRHHIMRILARYMLPMVRFSMDGQCSIVEQFYFFPTTHGTTRTNVLFPFTISAGFQRL